MRSLAAHRVVWFLALLVAVLGASISFKLALEPYKTPSQDQEKSALDKLCTAFETSSCEKVSKSRWGWFPPLPTKEELAKQKEKEAQGDDSSQQAEGSEQGEAAGRAGASTQPAAGAAEQAKKAQAAQKQGQSATTDKDEKAGRIPSGQLGLIYFSFMVVWLALIAFRPLTRRWPHVLFAGGALAGALGSGVFEYVMWKELDAWCPLCLIAHIASFLMPIFALLLWPRRTGAESGGIVVPRSHLGGAGDSGSGSLFASVADGRGGDNVPIAFVWPTNWVLLVSFVLAVVLVGGEHFVILNYASQQKVKTAQLYSDYYKKQWEKYENHWQHHYTAWTLKPIVLVPIEDRPVRGPETAKHEIVLFSDFECPACRVLEERLSKYVVPMSDSLGGMRIVFKHYPLCKDCNDQSTRTVHPAACDAALAAEAARIVGGDEAFWKMHDLLFEHQQVKDGWRKSRDFLPFAREIGLDLDAFRTAMLSSEALDRIRQDIADGANLGKELSEKQRAEVKVDNSTPTVFVNGKRLDSPSNPYSYRTIMQNSQSPRRVRQGTALPSPRPASGPQPATPSVAPPSRVP